MPRMLARRLLSFYGLRLYTVYNERVPSIRPLLSRCDNPRLLETIRTLKYHAQRYESAYMRHSGRIIRSAEQHRAILRALREGNLDPAARLLEANWKISQNVLLPWLREQEASKESSAFGTPPSRKGS